MELRLKAQSWCLQNNIKIYIKPKRNYSEVQIEINANGTIINSQKTYKNQKIASEKIWELYEYFYKKQKKL
tara:strand:+ start:4221 stop:4433 length:213 start_codon:yes stop_codon:yes gene_type:complete